MLATRLLAAPLEGIFLYVEIWRLISFGAIALVVAGLASAQRRASAALKQAAADAERGREAMAKLNGELAANREELQRSENALRLAEDAAAMGDWDWNVSSGEIVWSRRCKELFGLGADAAVSYDVFLSVLHPDDRATVDHAVREALAKKTDYDAEMRVCLPDGSVRWVAAKGRAFHEEDQRPIRVVGRVRETVEDLRPLFVQRRIALEFRAPSGAAWIDADATRVAQVVTNLLQNAAKFTDPSGRVSVSVEARAGKVHLTVSDDGAGLSPGAGSTWTMSAIHFGNPIERITWTSAPSSCS